MAGQPNIVFIFADDWGWGDLGCYGSNYLKTPNLDRLASEGALLSQFYVCSGVCSPSRAAVMTGRFPSELGLHGHLSKPELNAERAMPNYLDPQLITYTQLLHDNGYATAHFGKWHLGHSEDAPAPSAYGIDASRVTTGNGDRFEWNDVYTRGKTHGHVRSKSSRLIIDETIGFIEREKDRPFMVNVWLNDTHATLDPDESQLADYAHLRPDGLEDRFNPPRQVYGAVVSDADRHIGRLLHRLDELGLADNTLVIFSADNGPEDMEIRNASHSGVGSNGPFRGRKRSLYEGGIRVPFIARWAAGGIKPGTVDHTTPLCAVDFVPTFASLIGETVPSDVVQDGEDMSAVFRGQTAQRTTPLMWEWRFHIFGHTLHKSPMLAMREGDWKLLTNPDGSRTELYRIPDDPSELNNLAEEVPELTSQMRDRVLAWQQKLPEGPTDPDCGSNAYPWPGS